MILVFLVRVTAPISGMCVIDIIYLYSPFMVAVIIIININIKQNKLNYGT